MNFKNLSYIKKQNKTILTKNKTKREGKEQKEKKRRKKNGFWKESNSGPSARQSNSLLLRHVKHILE